MKSIIYPIPQYFDENWLSSSSCWTNSDEENQCSSSIDYLKNEGHNVNNEIFNLSINLNDLSITPEQALHSVTIYEFRRYIRDGRNTSHI